MVCSTSLTCFCGQDFSIFSQQSFSPCFELFIFVLGPFLLLTLMSSYYIGHLRPPDVNIRVPSSFKLRRMCIGISLLLTVAALLNDVILFKLNITAVMIVSYSIRLIALLVHFVFLWRLGLIHFEYTRGPGIVTFSWILTLPFYGVRMESIIVELLPTNNSTNTEINTIVNLCCIAGMLICQISYLVFVIQGNPHYRTVSLLSQDFSSAENLVAVTSNNSERYCNITEVDYPNEEENPCPSDSANWLSKLFFCWVQPLMSKGVRRMLNRESSVYLLPFDLTTENLSSRFEETFKHVSIESEISSTSEVNASGGSKKIKQNLLKTMHKTFGTKYYLLGLLKFFGDALGFAGPILLNKLVSFVESDEPIANGCYYAVALFVATLIGSLLMTHFDYQVNKIVIAMKSSLIGSIYTKTMHSKPVALAEYSTGEITNFMSTDVNRVVNFCPSFHQFWSLPFQVIVTLVLLHQQVGVVFLAALGLTLVMIVFNRYLAIMIGKYNYDLMQHKDNRVKLMTEILLGIRVIKFNVWEQCLVEEINGIRTKELKSLRGIKYFDALCVYLWATTPVLISLLIFSIYSSTGHTLTAAKVFTVIALINMLISPLNAFPWVINGLMEAWTSLNRLDKFMALPDLDLDKYYDTHATSQANDIVLRIDGASFAWNTDVKNNNVNHHVIESTESTENDLQDKDMLLQGVSLKVNSGQFIGIIGTVGSGKSSLLSAICAEMEKVKGRISLRGADGGVALVSQETWLQHASVRDNILWGQPYDQEFYEAIVECCALNEDFTSLPAGDATEVGENGVTLSGGQKARISLARAAYQKKDFYLLDDPLSAVDQHVAEHLYHHCIAGILREHTRILCTHHTKYLRNADIVIEMEGGRIKAIGAPSEILKVDFIAEDQTSTNLAASMKEDDTSEESREENAGLISAEEKATGTVALNVYKAYWLAIGGCLALSILSFVVLMQGSKVASDWWLSYWVNSTSGNATFDVAREYAIGTTYIYNASAYIKEQSILSAPLVIPDTSYTFLLTSGDAASVSIFTSHDTGWYLMVYGIIAASNSFVTLVRAFAFAYGGLRAAKVLHKNLLNSILQAPVSFFDVTPIGRIINRFSSDMYTIDDSLPFMLNIFLAQAAGLVATVVVTCYGLPYFAILLVPLSIFYYYTQQYYRYTSRELKRLSSISLSPIYAHFTESILGLPTIRAYRRAKMFRERNIALIDINQRCNFSTLAAQQWLAIRLQMTGVVMVTGVAFTAVLEQVYKKQSPVSAGLVGLALSYALSVTSQLSGVITSFTETEKQMVAVERQSYYIRNVPKERVTPYHELRAAWPSGGSIEFRHVNLRYRPSLPLAIDDISFKIEPGEKIGVVGRTGSGKSSLLLVLFGMVPTSGGAILIDDVSISKVPLSTLRSKMAIIPQDPFLFNGPIKTNLDPSGQVNEGQDVDDNFWWALESCGLREVVTSMGGLDTDAGERGRRLSVGQRQLLCLARALLRDVQIVCLDEATANIDKESDALLQRTLKQQFSRCTVITIAHRIETVLDSDRVLVMDGGKVAEFDSPKALLNDENGLFSQLVRRSGCLNSSDA